MLTNVDKKNAKKCLIFSCEKCDFTSSNKYNFNKHLLTGKHEMLTRILTNDDEKNVKNAKPYFCDCGKVYKYRQSFSVHKKKCQIKLENKSDGDKPSEGEFSFKQMFLEMVNQNKELQKTIIEQTKTIQEIIPKVGSNNNTNTNNIIINNLTLLNTNCKDAMSLTNFIESIEVGIKDLVYTSEKGLANGIVNLFLEHYNKLPIELRPVWCSDRKRKRMYIKDEEWEEDIDNVKTRAAITALTAKQIRDSGKYTKENPDWMEHDDKKDRFINIVRHTTQDMDDIKQTHIISNLLDSIHLTDSIKKSLSSGTGSNE